MPSDNISGGISLRINAENRGVRESAQEAKRRVAVQNQRGFSTPRALATVGIAAAASLGSIAVAQEAVLPHTSAEVQQSPWHSIAEPGLLGAVPGLAIGLLLARPWKNGKAPVAKPVEFEEYERKLFDNYGLIEMIGRGGFGKVFRARALGTGEIVAVKECILSGDDAQFALDMLTREAKCLQDLNRPPKTHPSIPRFVDFQRKITPEGENHAMLVLEFIEGQDVMGRMKECGGRLSLVEALTIAAYTARTLRFAWEKAIDQGGEEKQLKIVHRDIKPENIRLRKGVEGQAQIVILDWGLVKGVGLSKYTSQGDIAGSHQYMSPEQLRDLKDLDFRSSFYSLGCVLYEMITGRTPYGIKTPADLVKHLDPNVLPPNIETIRAEVPTEVSRVIYKMMAKKREDRQQNFEDLDRDLTTVLAQIRR